ncbi:MAG: hypothetical protein K2W82_04110 [Candidatus Obscuribacterales bacterium]|nr:hypothetical protein [Candidatus Obscuribacterales bacterium]
MVQKPESGIDRSAEEQNNQNEGLSETEGFGSLGSADIAMIRNDDIKGKGNDSVPPLTLVDAGADKNEQKSTEEKVADYSRGATKLFSRIDSDNDGFLSDKELGRAIESKDYTREEGGIIAATYEQRKRLANLSNDEWGSETSGISRKDFAEFEKVQGEQLALRKQVTDAREWSKANFTKADINGDGLLSEEELAAAAKQDNLSANDRNGIDFLKNDFEKIKKENPQGLTKEEIDDKYFKARGTDVQRLIGGIDMRVASRTKNDAPDQLFDNPSDPLESIKPEAMVQWRLGDCAFHGVVGSLAHGQPELIRDMIKDNKDGTYTVTFPGDPKHPVTVSKPTSAEMQLYMPIKSKDEKSFGNWPYVLEKAFGEYNRQNSWSGNNTSFEGANGGKLPEHVLKLMTGKTADSDSRSFTSESTTKAKMTEALNEKRAVVCFDSVNHAEVMWKGDRTTDGYVNNHVYSVLKYDPSGPDGGTVTLRDTYGSKPEQISFKKFSRNFDYYVYGSK